MRNYKPIAMSLALILCMTPVNVYAEELTNPPVTEDTGGTNTVSKDEYDKLKTDYDALESQVTVLNTQINTLNQTIEALKQNNQGANVTGIENSLSTLTSQMNNLANQINSIQSSQSGITSNVSMMSSSLSTLRSQSSSLQNNVTNLQNQVNQLNKSTTSSALTPLSTVSSYTAGTGLNTGSSLGSSTGSPLVIDLRTSDGSYSVSTSTPSETNKTARKGAVINVSTTTENGVIESNNESDSVSGNESIDVEESNQIGATDENLSPEEAGYAYLINDASSEDLTLVNEDDSVLMEDTQNFLLDDQVYESDASYAGNEEAIETEVNSAPSIIELFKARYEALNSTQRNLIIGIAIMSIALVGLIIILILFAKENGMLFFKKKETKESIIDEEMFDEAFAI